ncbi:allophanate hydrolase subunit 1 [Nocardioides humilatus]|uniref:Allophanate hydrolase subunit 1 n=1 Tax=Nocardioides humilatus TaxID=2607660 RepID=A0A5B1LMH9_9ACTN|nr:allophanate hydrolase subunit 1 [Nocardioides humilatus]KAA1420809.1 allophanate hydrolase subunit 1 [Nocardioides humilatus]
MNVLPYGDRALLLELPDTAAVVACVDALAVAPDLADLVDDLVPGARTVLVRACPGIDLAALRTRVAPELSALEMREKGPKVQVQRESEHPEIQIPVQYDGPDLSHVGELTGLGEAGVVAAHTASPWRVAFGGFAPGFGYLVGGDPRLVVPRRDSPRTRVPAGAVGLAGEFSGVYPRESPGGWQLIGRTDARMWDLDRDPPALLTPGARVRFVVA